MGHNLLLKGFVLCHLGVAEKHTGKGYSVPHSNTALILKYRQNILILSFHFINKYVGIC